MALAVLLFILKKGRDRYDLLKGCRPIVCLSHLLSLDEGMLQALFNRHVNAIRTDINVGYRARATLTQIPFYHRGVAEQADLMMDPMITYFGDMVSFFDEIAHDLLRTLASRIHVPEPVMERLMGNAEGAKFRTVTNFTEIE